MNKNLLKILIFAMISNLSCKKIGAVLSSAVDDPRVNPNELIIMGTPIVSANEITLHAANGYINDKCTDFETSAHRKFSSRVIKVDCGTRERLNSRNSVLILAIPKIHLYVEADEKLEVIYEDSVDFPLKNREQFLVEDFLIAVRDGCEKLLRESQKDPRFLSLGFDCMVPENLGSNALEHAQKTKVTLRRRNIYFKRDISADSRESAVPGFDIKSLGRVMAHSDSVSTIVLDESDKPRTALSISDMGNLALWDISNSALKWIGFLKETWPYLPNVGSVSPSVMRFPVSALLSESEKILLFGGQNGSIQKFNLSTGDFEKFLVKPTVDSFPVVALTRSADKRYLYFLEQSPECQNSQSGSPLWGFFESSRASEKNGCKTFLARLSMDSLQVENKQVLATGTALAIKFAVVQKRILILVVSAGKISLVDADSLSEVRSLTPEQLDPGFSEGFFSGADLSKDGRFLAISTKLGVTIVNLNNLKPESRLHARLKFPLTEPKFSNNDSEIIVSERLGIIYRFSLESRLPIQQAAGHLSNANRGSWANGLNVRLVPRLNAILSATSNRQVPPLPPIQIVEPDTSVLKWIDGVASFTTARPPIYPDYGVEIFRY